MTDEREREGERPEDLFEDLDTFFAPIEDLDAETEAARTAEEGSEPGPEAERREPEEAPAAAGQVPSPSGPPAGPEPGEATDTMPEALTPSDQGPDEEADWFAGPTGGSVDLGPDTGPDAPGATLGGGPGSTAELSGEEWDRFRDALASVELEEEEGSLPEARGADPFGAVAAPGGQGEGEARTEGLNEAEAEAEGEAETDGLGVGASASTPAGTTPVWEDEVEGEADLEGEPIGPEDAWLADETPVSTAGADADEDEGGITLEDLQAVPPVYRDLPGPEDEGEEVGVPSGTEALAEEEPPSVEAVEAAAEHFAESMRQSPEEVEEELLADLDRPKEAPSVIRVGDEAPAGGLEPIEPWIAADPGAPEAAGVGSAGAAEDLVAFDGPEGEEEEGPRGVRVGAADDLGTAGPSWQEPTSEEVELGPTVPAAGRSIPAAFITGLVLAVLGVGSLALGKAAFAVFAGGIVLLAQGELYAAMVRARLQPATAIGLIFGGLTLAAAYLRGEAAMLSMVALSVVFTFLWYMATPARARRGVVVSMGATLLGVVYAPLFAGYVLVTLAFPFEGRAVVIAIIALAFLFDIVAYAAGAGFGGSVFRRPLAPTISPRKSWEGVLFATVVVLAVSLLVVDANLDTIASSVEAIGLGLVVAIAATLGDLAESALKRDMRIKDMGTILPGHGGVLDRIDSVLFVAPAAFFFIRLFVV